MTTSEFRQRRYIHKCIFATINYLKSKLDVPLDIQLEAYPKERPTVWRIVLTIQYAPEPEHFQLVVDPPATSRGV